MVINNFAESSVYNNQNVSIKRNTSLNIIKTLSSIAFPLITFPYITRVLQPDKYGIFSFSNSIISYFSILANMGVTAYSIRECSRVKNDKKALGQIASEIMSLNIITTVISYILLALSLMLIPGFNGYKIVIAILSLNILFTIVGADWFNTAIEDFKYITIRTVAFQFLSLILMFLFIHHDSDYLKYAVITVIASSGAQVVNIFYRRKFARVRFTWKMKIKKHMPPIVVMFAMIVSQTILNNIDITMLGIMKGNSDVGLYSAAVRITSIVNQVISSISWVLLPQLSQNFAIKDYERVNNLLHKVLIFTVTLTLPSVAGLNILSSEIITIAGGTRYAGAANSLSILSIAMALFIASGVFGNMILLPSGREMQFAVVCTVGMLVNAILNLFLIPRFGIDGAAFATVIAALIFWIGTMIKLDKNIHFDGIVRIFVGPVMGSAVIILIGLVIRSLELNLWIGTGLAVVLSVIGYFAMQIATKNEMVTEALAAVRRRTGY